MNCVNHPETPVTSFCQNCGKALCAECTRPVGGFIYCEQCLAARVGAPAAAGVPFAPGMPPMTSGPNTALATVLGVIPGVGAMYNGQFVKAMIHVLVFVLLIAITDSYPFFGFFIAAWVLYQIFDANQTAKARRDGMPLPDPFGINELANRLQNQTQYPGSVASGPVASGSAATGSVPPGFVPPGPVPPGPVPPGFVPPGFEPSASVPPAGYPPPPNPTSASFVGGASYASYPSQGASYPPPPPPYPPLADIPPPIPPFPAKRNEPAGAIVLIVLGLLFLFGTLGIFSFHWIERGWPLIIIGIGVWLFFKQARRTLPPGGGQ